VTPAHDPLPTDDDPDGQDAFDEDLDLGDDYSLFAQESGTF
jgi:hypothetical protein